MITFPTVPYILIINVFHIEMMILIIFVATRGSCVLEIKFAIFLDKLNTSNKLQLYCNEKAFQKHLERVFIVLYQLSLRQIYSGSIFFIIEQIFKSQNLKYFYKISHCQYYTPAITMASLVNQARLHNNFDSQRSLFWILVTVPFNFYKQTKSGCILRYF